MPGAGGMGGGYGSDQYANAMRLMAMGDILKGGNGASYYNYMQQLEASKKADARFAAQQSAIHEQREYERMLAEQKAAEQAAMLEAAQGGMSAYFASMQPNPVQPFDANDPTGADVAANAMAFVRPELFPGLSQSVIDDAARNGTPASSALVSMFYNMPDDVADSTRAGYDDGMATFSYNDQEARDWARQNAPGYGYGFEGAGPQAKFDAQQSMPSPVSPERLSQIMTNPMVPQEIKDMVISRFATPEDDRTAEIQNLEWRAEQAGLTPGTPEYREFILTGGKSGGNTFSVTTADGTAISWGPGGAPPGSDPLSTATPRDAGKLSESLSSADASYLTSERDRARAAEDLEGLADRLETLSGDVGYTGPGGKIYGAVDDVIGILPGDKGARGAFRSASTEAQLTFTERTKGAITEREMALFAAAVPSLSQTKEANQFISQSLRAGAQRVQTRANFMEAWAGKYGSLEGAEGAWDSYIQTNPLLSKDETTGDLKTNPEGDWQSYLTATAKIELNPLTIMQMSASELAQITPDTIATMTMPQIQALEARRREVSQ